MARLLIAIAMTAALAMPASAQLAQATGMTGDARKSFMSSCLSGGGAETKKPHCTKGKPCGNSCIAKDAVCHQP